MSILVALLALAIQTPASSEPPTAAALEGEWSVDLSVKADEPYVRPMRLTLAPDGTVSGLFYQSPIDGGRWKIQHGRVCVSFRTHDDNTPYHTAACLAGDHVEGQTWAEGRNFIFLWNATRPLAGS